MQYRVAFLAKSAKWTLTLITFVFLEINQEQPRLHTKYSRFWSAHTNLSCLELRAFWFYRFFFCVGKWTNIYNAVYGAKLLYFMTQQKMFEDIKNSYMCCLLHWREVFLYYKEGHRDYDKKWAPFFCKIKWSHKNTKKMG